MNISNRSLEPHSLQESDYSVPTVVAIDEAGPVALYGEFTLSVPTPEAIIFVGSIVLIGENLEMLESKSEFCLKFGMGELWETSNFIS